MEINDLNLCYCLNAFDFNTLKYSEKFLEIHNHFNQIRKDLNYTKPFALGLWTNAKFIQELQSKEFLNFIKDFLKKNNYYVFTLNAFPYGDFHNKPVKAKVYRPDWRDEKRMLFTCKSADFLSELLPLTVQGSISTVPGAYKYDLNDLNKDTELIAKHFIKTAECFARIYERTGKRIYLAVEMEPDCLWESPQEFIEFYHKYLADNKYASEYIGVCYDTSHQELLQRLAPGDGLQLLIDNNIKIAKIQLSTALKTKRADISAFDALKLFSEPVYLHQTRVFSSDGKILHSFSDIPNEMLDSYEGFFCSHFHVPLFTDYISDTLMPAKSELQIVLAKLKEDPKICNNIEIETYTYGVLPQILNKHSLIENITKEYKWVIKSLI